MQIVKHRLWTYVLFVALGQEGLQQEFLGSQSSMLIP